MKKINKLLPIFILGLLISCQTDWKTDYEKTIENFQKDFSIIKQVDTIENSSTQTKIYSYETDGVLKLEVNFKMENLFDISTEYYKNDSLIFVEKVYGLSPLLYKRKRKIEEPIGALIEKISYFKENKTGIEKFRQVEFYLGDNKQKRMKELEKLDFEIKEIGKNEYSHIEKMYERYSKY